jgi:hypothetical protein
MVVVGVIFALAVTIFAGCSKEELGFYNLSKEVNSIKAYEGSEKLTLAINLPDDLTGDPQAAIAAALLKNMVFDIQYKADNTKMDAEMDITMTIASDKYELGKFIMKDNIVYCPVAGIKKFVEKYGNEQDIKDFYASIGEAEYITIDYEKDLGLKNADSFLDNYQSMLLEIFSTSDKLLLEGYKDFSLGDDIISSTSNGYKFYLKDSQIAPLFIRLAEYTINNSQQVRAGFIELCSSSFVREYLGLINIPQLSHAQMISDLNGAFDYIADPAAKAEILTSLKEMKSQLPEITKAIKGSYVEYKLGKNSDGSYVSNMDILINAGGVLDAVINVEDKSNSRLSLALKDSTTIKPVSSVDITAPTGKMVTLSELAPATTTMKIKVSGSGEGKYSIDSFNIINIPASNNSSSGTITVIVKNGNSYLPLRQVAEIFAENITWDNNKKAAIVTTNNGQTVTFTGLSQKGRVFVKMRDFEKLGYQLNWDSVNKIITITNKAA